MGSLKKQLVFQFLTESVLLTFIATIFAYSLVFLLLPYFNHVSGKNTLFSFFIDFNAVSFILVLSILVGVLAGIYPSFFLSSFNTIKVLKGSSSGRSGRNVLRNGLVIFQFVIGVVFIIGSIVVLWLYHLLVGRRTI